MRDERKRLVTLGVVIFILHTNPAIGAGKDGGRGYQQPIQEVFQTEVVYPQEKGEIQLTGSPRFHEGDAQDLLILPFAIEYGLTDSWQVELEWNSLIHHNPSAGSSNIGIGDLELGTKYSFMNVAGSNFHVAPGLEIGFPAGDPQEGLGEGMLEIEPFASLAYDFPKLNDSQIFTQVGFGFASRLRGDEEAAHEITWNAGFFVPFWQLRYTTELNWTTNEWNGGDENELYLTPGFVWDLPGTWEAGVGVPIGINDDADNFRVIAMLTYEFNMLRKDND